MTWLSPASNETVTLIVFLLLLISFQETLLLKHSLTSHGFSFDVFSIFYQFSTLHKLLFIWIFITSFFFPYVAYCFLICYSCLHSSTERECAFHQYNSATSLWSNGFLAILYVLLPHIFFSSFTFLCLLLPLHSFSLCNFSQFGRPVFLSTKCVWYFAMASVPRQLVQLYQQFSMPNNPQPMEDTSLYLDGGSKVSEGHQFGFHRTITSDFFPSVIIFRSSCLLPNLLILVYCSYWSHWFFVLVPHEVGEGLWPREPPDHLPCRTQGLIEGKKLAQRAGQAEPK